jgi:hypothetical protein
MTVYIGNVIDGMIQVGGIASDEFARQTGRMA